jgi:hypothetical protein
VDKDRYSTKKMQIVLEYFIALKHRVCNKRSAYPIFSNRRTLPADESKYGGLDLSRHATFVAQLPMAPDRKYLEVFKCGAGEGWR